MPRNGLFRAYGFAGSNACCAGTEKFILGKAQEEALFAEAEKFGAVSMRSDGVQKVLKGHTSLAEVLQAVH